jgi:hypothetical protein
MASKIATFRALIVIEISLQALILWLGLQQLWHVWGLRPWYNIEHVEYGKNYWFSLYFVCKFIVSWSCYYRILKQITKFVALFWTTGPKCKLDFQIPMALALSSHCQKKKYSSIKRVYIAHLAGRAQATIHNWSHLRFCPTLPLLLHVLLLTLVTITIWLPIWKNWGQGSHSTY